MQIWGLDHNGKMVLAEQAYKGKNYRCPECQSLIRKRSPRGKRPHFFHLYKTHRCILKQKSYSHVAIQLAIYSCLPKGQAHMEYRMKNIGRIADVIWLEKGLVFEVQCSKISLQEIQRRRFDYASIGFTIVWILQDKVFNRRYFSSSEMTLREELAYYTNIGSRPYGYFYDQFEVCYGKKRLYKTKPHIINLSSWQKNTLSKEVLPQCLRAKGSTIPGFFSGDLIDLTAKRPNKGRFLDLLQRSILQKARRKWQQRLKRMIKLTRVWLHNTLFRYYVVSHTPALEELEAYYCSRILKAQRPQFRNSPGARRNRAIHRQTGRDELMS